jgi:polyhydroxyalkanoate synthesis regulator phasin
MIMATKKAKKKTKKAAKKTKKKTVKAKSGKWTWADILRTPILASVGAFSLAEEGVEKFVKELVERGEASEKEGRKIVKDFQKRTSRNRKDFEKKTDERIEKALRAFRLPTAHNLNALSKKVERLERRVDRLAKRGK